MLTVFWFVLIFSRISKVHELVRFFEAGDDQVVEAALGGDHMHPSSYQFGRFMDEDGRAMADFPSFEVPDDRISDFDDALYLFDVVREGLYIAFIAFAFG